MNRQHTLVFYDGHCGLCHGAVLFALRRDTDGDRFRFAPLQGETLRQQLSEDRIAELADSIVVIGVDGSMLQESDAVLLILEQVGGGWKVFGRISSWVPRPLRDGVYRGIAKIRHRLFRRQTDLCPMVPVDLRSRFLP